MEFTDLYTVESLQCFNGFHYRGYRINQSDTDKVNLVLQGSSTNVDKQKATAVMQDFFTKNKVNGFTVNHQGKRDESSFVIGTLATTNGNFRVNCFLKKVQDKCLIHQIRIDKINE